MLLCCGRKTPAQVWAWMQIEASAVSDNCSQRVLLAVQVMARVLKVFQSLPRDPAEAAGMGSSKQVIHLSSGLVTSLTQSFLFIIYLLFKKK